MLEQFYSWYAEWLMWFTQFSGNWSGYGDYSIPVIYLLAAAVLFALWKVALRDEVWALTLAYVYLLDALLGFSKLWGFEELRTWPDLLSPSLLWLTAIALKREGNNRYLEGKPTEDGRPLLQYELFSLVYTRKSFFILAVSITFIFLEKEEWLSPFNRLSLALIYFVAICVVAQAISKEISYRAGRINQTLSFIFQWTTWALSFFSLTVWAFNPLFMLHSVGETLGDWWLESIKDFPGLNTLDHSAVLGLASAKIVLFFGALFVLAKSLKSWASDQYMLNDVTNEKTEIMDPECRDGLLKALGRDLDADAITILVSLPSKQKVAWWAWFDEEYRKGLEHDLKEYFNKNELPEGYRLHEGIKSPMILPHPSHNESIAGEVFLSQKMKLYGTKSERHLRHKYKILIPNIESVLCLPIFYQGWAIAVLTFYSKRPYKFTPSAVQRAERYARLLAPMTHPNRELNALDQISEKLTKVVKNIDKEPSFFISGKDNDLALPLKNLLGEIAKVILKYTEASSLVMNINIGFFRLSTLLPGANLEPKFETIDLSDNERNVNVTHPYSSALKTLKTTAEGQTKVEIGKLYLSEPRDQSTLVRGEPFRKSVADRLTQAYLEGVIFIFTQQVRTLRSELAKETNLTTLILFGHVNNAFAKLQCVISAVIMGSLYGNNFDSTIETKYIDGQVRWNEQDGSILLDLEGDALFSLKSANGLSDHELQLVFSPWLRFLNNMTATISHALQRIKANQLSQIIFQMKLQAEKSLVSGLWLHELSNSANVISLAMEFSAELLYQNANKEALQVLKEAIPTAGDFKTIINKLSVSSNEEIKTPLISDVIGKCHQYYKFLFERHNITWKVTGDTSAYLKMPLSHAYLVFSNLTANAIRFLKRSKERWIHIHVQQDQAFLTFSFTDSGSGVPAEIQDRIFEQGFSTDPKHTGLGLSGIRALIVLEYRGSLELDRSYGPGARFLCSLPGITGAST